MNGYIYYLKNIIAIFTTKKFEGWGRKKTGKFALWCNKIFGGTIILKEDGFIRSIGLGVDNSPSFSIIEDDVGIYYDATQPSQLEKILNTYDFKKNTLLLDKAQKAISLIKKYHISKYNNAPILKDNFFKDDNKEKILVITQTANDSSLQYGVALNISTLDIIKDAVKENPNHSIYIKIHPDVMSGKKKSDINLKDIPKEAILIQEDVNPISLLKQFKKVYTKTSGMGMEALILGLEVVCYGLPYYAGWGVTLDKQFCKRRIRTLTIEEIFAGAYILYSQYSNPYREESSDIIDTIETIIKYRTILQHNNNILYFFGFSRWKRKFIKPFFSEFKKNNIIFCSSLEEARKKGLMSKSKIYIWGKKLFKNVEEYAKNENISIFRVEDGFIRSISLGSDLTKAYSLSIDSRGIYFDATHESDLEYMLNNYCVNDKLIQRSKEIQEYLIKNKISKYNIYEDKKITITQKNEQQTIALVIGQVEDDASIKYGAEGMSNLELLKIVKKQYPDKYIIYKPHPDVLVGNRVGMIAEELAFKYCDRIIIEHSLDSVLEVIDEVHTMTSLVGFEGLIRGKKVYTYGVPFYANWGLTIDAKKCDRRKRARILDELVAISLIVYPRYINPKTNELCEIEVLLKEIDKEKKRYNSSKIYRYFVQMKNFISRKIQFLIKVIVREQNRRDKK